MNWCVHPAKDQLKKTIVSLVFLSAFLVFVFVLMGALFAVLGFIFLFVSLHSYYFSTSYEIDNESVTIRTIFGTHKRKFSEFKRLYTGKNGALLSPFRHKTFLNNFRGVFLYYPGVPEKREEILKFLKTIFPPQDEIPEKS